MVNVLTANIVPNARTSLENIVVRHIWNLAPSSYAQEARHRGIEKYKKTISNNLTHKAKTAPKEQNKNVNPVTNKIAYGKNCLIVLYAPSPKGKS